MARAEIAARAGDDALVFEALERAEQADPLSARGPLALASYLRAHGAPERADAVLLRYEARALAGTREAQLVHLRRALASGDVERIFEATSPYRMGAPPEAAELSEAARVLLEQQRSAQALRVIELVPETPNETGLRLRVFVACARFATAEAWLASHEPEGIEARAAAVRVYLALGQLGRANDLLEATKLDRSASERPGVLQLLAAKIALARGDVSEAALSFARAAAFQGTRAEALRGLAEALRGAALPELASELPAQ
jgi:predicted Zn-dependent protease